jgi:hypothetical protein
MPRQNRVTPFGALVAVPERGTLMGNRGVLHDDRGAIRRAWALRRWILCVLQFKDRKRTVMTPGRYTELFFLDEATGLAAGHRPCAECQRQRFRAFRAAWSAGNRHRTEPSAEKLDDRLHAERVSGGEKVRFTADLDKLPDGVFVTLTEDDTAWLLWRGELLAWTPGGYRQRVPRPASARVSVLTPASTVEAIRAGYEPQVHPTGGVG